MTIDLDVSTLRATVSAVFGFAALFFAIASRVHPEEQALRSWMVANLLCAGVNLAVMLREVQGNVIWVMLVGTIYALGFAFNWVGLRQLFGAPLPWRASGLLAALVVGLTMVLPAAGLLTAMQGVRYLLWFVPGMLAVAWAVDLLRLTKGQRTPIVWFLAGSSAATGLTVLAAGLFGLYADMTGHLRDVRMSLFTLAYAMLMPGTLAVNWGAMMMFSAKLREEMKRLASIDGLTGLFNRRAFKAEAERIMAESATSAKKCGLLVLDLDYFKSINDTYGHSGGDEVLRNFSALLSGQVRPGDLTGRVGGEEFCLLMPEADEDTVMAFAECVRRTTAAAQVPCGDATVRITTSIGVALARPGEDINDLFTRADRALFVSKTEGRNRVTLASMELVDRRKERRTADPSARPGIA